MPTPDGLEGKSINELEDSLATLQQQLNALQAEISKRKGGDGQNKESTSTTSADRMEYSGRLYRWGNERITQQDVLNVVNAIKEPYSSEISNYMKSNNIKGLQRYLNERIDKGDIDSSKLKEILSSKGIWLSGNHILEDGMFGPQTLETIKFLVKESGGDSGVSTEIGASTPVETGGDGASTPVETGGDGASTEVLEKEYIVDENKDEKFGKDRFNSLKRRASSLLPSKVSMVWVESGNPENPEFTVKIDDKYNGSVVKYVKFNFHDYLNGDTFYNEKFKEDVRKAKEEWYEERTFQNWLETKNKYSLEELFPGESSSVSLSQFFEMFRNGKLKISNASFDIDGDKLHFQFKKGGVRFNSEKWCYQEIDKQDLKGEDGKYSQEKFKEKLRDIVREISSQL